jgi:hypothetical protein
MLPPSQVKWITDQPESILNSTEAQREELQTDYTLLDQALAEHPVHYQLIKGNLMKEMDTLIPEVMDEIEASVDDYWGRDSEGWSDIAVFDTMMKAVSRATNRIFVGLPLCMTPPSVLWTKYLPIQVATKNISSMPQNSQVMLQ